MAFRGWEDVGEQQEGKSWRDMALEEVTSGGCWHSLSGKLALGAGRAGASFHFYRQEEEDKDTPEGAHHYAWLLTLSGVVQNPV